MVTAVQIQQLRRARSLLGAWPTALAVLLMASSPAAAVQPVHHFGGVPTEITRTAEGRAVARAAHLRLSRSDQSARQAHLAVWRDGSGLLVAPRNARLVAVPSGPGGSAATLVPLVAPAELFPRGRMSRLRSVAAESPQSSWLPAASACYERISDTWSWLDHCARIYRLAGDGDPARDYYGLQRVATAGANAPWVVKSAVIAGQPTDPNLMTWVDWSPRGDRSGACQSYIVWVTAPSAGLTVTADRCENWDITKGARGGDFRLEWSGCACVRDRSLAFDVTVSVPQGRLPGWYVPAEVHGFAF